MKFIKLVILICFCLNFNPVGGNKMENDQSDYRRITISGTNFNIIQKALPELEEHDLDIKEYTIIIRKTKDVIVVMFSDPFRETNPTILGGSPDIQELEVHLDKETLDVKKSFFPR